MGLNLGGADLVSVQDSSAFHTPVLTKTLFCARAFFSHPAKSTLLLKTPVGREDGYRLLNYAFINR